MKCMYLLLCSTLEYHTLLHLEVMPSLMAYFDEVMLLHILTHLSSKLLMLENDWCACDVVISYS